MNVLVLFASARPGREGEKVANWVVDQLRKRDDMQPELVDAAALNLPFYNEPVPSLMIKEYVNPDGAAWAARVAKADAIIFVTAEYNHGYTGLMKNTIDWVGRKWADKLALFVSYGADAGGARAVEQLKPVVAQLKMIIVSHPAQTVSFPHIYMGAFDENGEALDASRAENLTANLDELVRVSKLISKSA